MKGKGRFCIAAALAMGLFSPAAVQAKEMHSWGYEGENGPAKWGTLSPEYRMCSEGRNQSPIDLGPNVVVAKAGLAMPRPDYGKARATAVVNNGHTIKVEVAKGGTLSIGKHAYRLLQFHMHAPSENTVEGKHFPMEIHFVHADDAGNLAVIGVMVKEGAENPVFGKIWEKMPAQKGKADLDLSGKEIASLITDAKAFYRFNGSLTTPPCSEGVVWVVLKKPLELSAGQIETFRKTMGFANNRPTQPLNARIVVSP